MSRFHGFKILNMVTIIDKKTGKELFATADDYTPLANEIAVKEMRTEVMDNPFFDFKKRIFFDIPTAPVTLTANEIETKIADLKAQMGKELAVTDWYYIRRLETLEDVPIDVQDERAAIRLKFETEINNLMK